MDKTKIKFLNEFTRNYRMLYHVDFYDGPLSGMMLWDGEKVWFNCVDQDHNKIYYNHEQLEEMAKSLKCSVEELEEEDTFDIETIWTYNVYELDHETINILDYNNQLFIDNVGSYCSYDENGKRLKELKPVEQHPNYWNNKKEFNLDLDNRKIIGQFKR